tara:strand:- start:401 stop:667 length:267 start_codon:yes stop_codon:yes gene_type:complete
LADKERRKIMTKDQLIELAIETFWHNTAEGQPLDTANNEYTISDDQTTVAKYYLLDNKTGSTKKFNDIECLFTKLPKKIVSDFISYYA